MAMSTTEWSFGEEGNLHPGSRQHQQVAQRQSAFVQLISHTHNVLKGPIRVVEQTGTA